MILWGCPEQFSLSFSKFHAYWSEVAPPQQSSCPSPLEKGPSGGLALRADLFLCETEITDRIFSYKQLVSRDNIAKEKNNVIVSAIT